MPDKLSFSKTIRALESAINITQQRHSLIASNISNLDTPQYKAKDIEFKTALGQALESNQAVHLVRTNAGHIGSTTNSSERFEPYEDESEWNGYNWVNIDREMTKLIENNLRYRSATEVLLRKITLLKDVIKEGGR